MADVLPNPNAGASGTEMQTVAALRKLGHDVDTVWADDLWHFIRHGNLHYLFELPLAYRKVMLQRITAKKYDVIHVNQPHGYLAARAIAGRPSAPVFVHRSHGFEARVRSELQPWQKLYGRDTRSTFRRSLSMLAEGALEFNNRSIARYASGHIVSASDCKKFLISRYNVADARIATIPQAAPECFQITPARGMDTKRLHKLLYVGQFAFFKAPMVLARAAQKILEECSEASLTWVCAEEHHVSVRALFSNPEILDRIFLVPWTSQSDLMEIYDQHGIFLFPSFFEGFGKAFLEAMARGLIVIGADNGGMRDIISHTENGFLHKTGDFERLAYLAKELLDKPGLASAVSAKARQTALAYTWSKVARETEIFYGSIMRLRDVKR